MFDNDFKYDLYIKEIKMRDGNAINVLTELRE